MKIAITGGAGFLGLHLANNFNQKKAKVSLIDIQSINSDEYHGKPTFLNLDIRSLNQLSKAVSGHDIVIHAAAALPLWKKEDIISTNVKGTENVLKASQKNKVKRVIYISSTAVYGVPTKHPIEETDPLVGVGTYGETKISAEKLCQKFMEKGLNITIIRPKTFVGTARLGVFEILFDWIHDGKKIPLIGNGKNRYQLLDVDDLVEAVYLFSANDRSSYNQAFNIGAAKYKTISEDLQELFNHAKSGSTLLPLPPKPIKLALKVLESLNLSPLYQWVYDTADTDSFVSIEKLTNVLKWSPKFSNSRALIKSFDWYQEHYREIKSRKSGVTHTVGWKQGALGIAKKFL
jgi:nucleoside-diphosphate-sugar epimerase